MANNKLHQPLDYPIVIKKVEDHLAICVPDLNIFFIEPLPDRGKITPKYLMTIAKAVAKCWLSTQSKLSDYQNTNLKPPSGSMIKKILKSDRYKRLTAPQVAALTGLSTDTIRRKADKGEIPCEVSEGGTRYFREKDVLPYFKISR
ncbi:MAG: helix-turn-helix domain-containing protein [Bdellovibrionales bacterium]|nr:helix-turn-helix domain-containing protein [Bdellovibrionales bacterium]